MLEKLKGPLQTITIEDILRVAPRFIKAGRLGAQCKADSCQYERKMGNKISRCIIGTVMTENTIRQLQKRASIGAGIDHLIREGVISVPKEQAPKIIRLQKLHDMWAMVGQLGDVVQKERRQNFYDYLKELHTEYAV